MTMHPSVCARRVLTLGNGEVMFYSQCVPNKPTLAKLLPNAKFAKACCGEPMVTKSFSRNGVKFAVSTSKLGAMCLVASLIRTDTDN